VRPSSSPGAKTSLKMYNNAEAPEQHYLFLCRNLSSSSIKIPHTDSRSSSYNGSQFIETRNFAFEYDLTWYIRVRQERMTFAQL